MSVCDYSTFGVHNYFNISRHQAGNMADKLRGYGRERERVIDFITWAEEQANRRFHLAWKRGHSPRFDCKMFSIIVSSRALYAEYVLELTLKRPDGRRKLVTARWQFYEKDMP